MEIDARLIDPDSDFRVPWSDIGIYNRVNEQGVPKDIYDSIIAATIAEAAHAFIWNGKVYLYRNGVYHCDDDGSQVRTIAGKFMAQQIQTAARERRVFDLLSSRHNLRISETDINAYPTKAVINFTNGVLNLETGRLIPHDPQYHGINQVPHEWPPEHCDYELVNKYLDNLVPDEDSREMLLEYLGYCLTPDTSQQVLLCMIGRGGSGKSDLLRMMQLLNGDDNTSNISLQDLNGRFDTARLVGKTLNIFGDLPPTDMVDISGIKLVTGEDMVRAEYKGGKIFAFRNYSKQLFSANRMPRAKGDCTDAFYRRLLLLPIPDRATMTNIPNQKNRLTTPAALAALLELIVEAAERMYKRGTINRSLESEYTVRELERQTDTVAAWLDSGRVQRDHHTEPRGELLTDYLNFCEDERRTPLSATEFYRHLREAGFGETKSHSPKRFAGIRLTRG